MKRIIYILTSLFVLASCSKSDEFMPPAFNYEIPDLPLTADVLTGAYYYNYSETDWSKKYSDTPKLGQYSALNQEVMTQHRKWADLAALNFFIFNWNAAANDNALIESFTTGRTEAVKMVINFNLAHLKATNASPLAGEKLTTMITELKAIAAQHFTADHYFRIDNRPVLMMSQLNLAANAAGSVDFTVLIPAIREALKADGFDPYIIGEITSGWLPPQRYATSIKSMNGVVLNNWSTDVYDRAVFFPSYSDMNWKNWSDSTRAWGTVDYIPCVFPGFNDKEMTPASKLYNINRSEQFYRDYANVAKRNMSERRLVLINSWNHFQLGTSIEPTVEDEEKYLELTKKFFKKAP